MTHNGPVLRVTEAVKRFGGVAAVDGVSLELHPGRILALIGPNGAGKSTLMRLITGEERMDAGSLEILGRKVTGRSPHHISRLGLGRTYQEGRLFWSMSVLENLLISPFPQIGDSPFGALFRRRRVRLQEREHRERAYEALDTVGLRPLASHLAGSLSGGQRRLVEMARLMMTDARVAVLDEPTAGLAPSMVVVLEDMLRLLARRGLGLMVVEHHMGLVGRASDEVRVMALGKIMAEGTYQEVSVDEAVREAYLGV